MSYDIYKIRRYTGRNLANMLGWRNSQRIVVFESDDWGSIRMPSVESFKILKENGLNLCSLDAERYNLNDTLASRYDLERLFEILGSFKDKRENFPVFTAVTVVANPDFRKIRESNFQNYYFEPFTETLKRFSGCENSFELWKQGINSRLFVPQMHGREHLNVKSWVNALRNGDRETLLAFEEGMWGFIPDQDLLPHVDYQAAFLFSESIELNYQKDVINEGLAMFENIFGYKAEYFVPPNGVFNNALNLTLVQNGVKFRFAPTIQHEPLGLGRTRKVLHWLGQKDNSGLRYISRNCFFEPSQIGNDWVDSCLNDIKIAFRWNKPAIISTHRVNFISALNPKNADNGLAGLKTLLKSIVINWPEAIFMTTPELGEIITLDTL